MRFIICSVVAQRLLAHDVWIVYCLQCNEWNLLTSLLTWMNVTGGHGIHSIIAETSIILRQRSPAGTALATPLPNPANTVHKHHTIHNIPACKWSKHGKIWWYPPPPQSNGCLLNDLKTQWASHNATELLIGVSIRRGERGHVDWVAYWLITRWIDDVAECLSKYTVWETDWKCMNPNLRLLKGMWGNH